MGEAARRRVARAPASAPPRPARRLSPHGVAGGKCYFVFAPFFFMQTCINCCLQHRGNIAFHKLVFCVCNPIFVPFLFLLRPSFIHTYTAVGIIYKHGTPFLTWAVLGYCFRPVKTFCPCPGTQNAKNIL